MALILECEICGGTCLNNGHTECDKALLADNIFDLQKHLKRKPLDPIPTELVKRIQCVQVEPLASFLKKKSTKATKELEQSLWESAKARVAQKAMEKFENRNPPPTSGTY